MKKILVRDKKNPSLYSFLQVKKEVMKETTEKVDDGTGNLVDKVVQTPTGQFENVIFATEDADEFEERCKDLLRTYNLDELKFIDDLEYDTDFIWK